MDPHVSDAGLDPDGDGVNNLAEYLGQTDPLRSNTEPRLRRRK